MAGMLLRNYFNAIAAGVFNKTNYQGDMGNRETNYSLMGNRGYIVNSGSVMDAARTLSLSQASLLSGGATRSYEVAIYLGANGKEVTFDDYEFTPLSGFTVSQVYNNNVVYNEETERWESSRKFTINNVTDTDLVVREIAVCASDSSGSEYLFMLYRCVLDNAVTIPAQESGSLILNFAAGL